MNYIIHIICISMFLLIIPGGAAPLRLRAGPRGKAHYTLLYYVILYCTVLCNTSTQNNTNASTNTNTNTVIRHHTPKAHPRLPRRGRAGPDVRRPLHGQPLGRNTYIYIYIHIHACVYIYIYI